MPLVLNLTLSSTAVNHTFFNKIAFKYYQRCFQNKIILSIVVFSWFSSATFLSYTQPAYPTHELVNISFENTLYLTLLKFLVGRPAIKGSSSSLSDGSRNSSNLSQYTKPTITLVDRLNATEHCFPSQPPLTPTAVHIALLMKRGVKSHKRIATAKT